MESIELSEITAFPRDKLLYSEVLCDKVNSKLKKLHVKIKQTAAADASRVYNLDIKGVRHKFHLQINFTPQELCFLRFEEFQENVQEPSCFACLNRNYYPNIVYSRLMFLLYSDPGDGTEAKCIKIPFLQRGNICAATSLRKLQFVLHKCIASQDNLKHWLVRVVSCIGFDPGEHLFLGITKYAVVIVQYFHILQYHTFYSSEFSVKTVPGQMEIEIIVTNKSDPAMRSQYVFKSVDWQSIESTLKSIQRQSVHDLPKPSAHFNIIHSEVSASGFVPGTTSDNVAIVPHYHYMNNNSSSGSNGYLHPTHPTDEVIVHKRPEPHMSHQWTSNSNGHIPVSDSFSQDYPDDTFVRHSDVMRPSNIPLIPELNDPALNASLPSPHRLVGNPGENTDPSSTLKDLTLPRSSSTDALNGLHNLGFELGPGDVSQVPSFVDDDFDLPPPRPCSAQPHPHGEIFAWPVPVPIETDDVEPSLPAPHTRMLRSLSCSLSDTDIMEHWYVNVEQYQLLRNNAHADSPYVHFYYNVGFVRFARMSKKLKRRKRLSKEMLQVDFNKLENHEQWFDRCYKLRDKDLRFCRLSRMNIETEDPDIYSSVTEESPKPDDPYWKSSLCLTIQQMLQENPSNPRLSEDIQQAFDLTLEQLTSIQVLLSLVPSEKNWRDLAEFIGLDSSDVSIIEHYCYTYRELAARVVLYHWLLEYRQGKLDKTSSYENLHSFIEDIERRDIKDIMDSQDANKHLQSQEDLTMQMLKCAESVENIDRNDTIVVREGVEDDELLEEEFITRL